MTAAATPDTLARLVRSTEQHLGAGRVAQAREAIRELQATFPGSAEGHRLDAVLALREGNASRARAQMAEACRVDPEDGQMQFRHGSLLAHLGELEQAVVAFRNAVARLPGLAPAWHALGLASLRAGKVDDARAALRRANTLEPGNARTLGALADLEFQHGFPADALPLWEEIFQRAPRDPHARLRFGECLSRMGRHEEAVALYRDGLQRHPGDAGFMLALAQSLEDAGDPAQAADAYRDALARRPGWPYALAGLIGLLRGRSDAELLDQGEAAMRSGGLADLDASLLGYAIGRARDARGEHAGALRHWQEANAARQRMIGPPDPAPLRRRVEALRSGFTAARLARRPNASADPRPVFIVGMPRSGTTLCEQILAQHRDAFGCGELPDMGLVARTLPGHPDEVDAARLDAAIARYLDGLTRHAPAGARRLVDKEPLNFLQLGWIALMFPEARVVWCRRDPRDVAISIYGENFGLDETLATDFGALGHYISLQHRLMRHWQEVVPLPVHEVRYEDLVREPEREARRLLGFVGLEWDPACLDFHKSRRAVQTPSRWQVREPIHTRAIGRWRPYADSMEPLMRSLDPELRAGLS